MELSSRIYSAIRYNITRQHGTQGKSFDVLDIPYPIKFSTS